jgi:hypothetical protein
VEVSERRKMVKELQFISWTSIITGSKGWIDAMLLLNRDYVTKSSILVSLLFKSEEDLKIFLVWEKV